MPASHRNNNQSHQQRSGRVQLIPLPQASFQEERLVEGTRFNTRTGPSVIGIHSAVASCLSSPSHAFSSTNKEEREGRPVRSISPPFGRGRTQDSPKPSVRKSRGPRKGPSSCRERQLGDEQVNMAGTWRTFVEHHKVRLVRRAIALLERFDKVRLMDSVARLLDRTCVFQKTNNIKLLHFSACLIE